MQFIANGFIYRKSNSIIHKLDPRVKLLISIQLFTLALLVSDLYNLLIIFSAIAIFSLLGKITQRLLRTMIFATGFSVLIFFKCSARISNTSVTSVRFVPVILMDTLQIMDAQKSRGLELEKGNPIARIKKFVPILVPLIINEVIRSGELAEAMESRGYGISKNPTSLYSLKLVNFDMIVISITMISFVSVILFGY